jgi:hypothetical protein
MQCWRFGNSAAWKAGQQQVRAQEQIASASRAQHDNVWLHLRCALHRIARHCARVVCQFLNPTRALLVRTPPAARGRRRCEGCWQLRLRRHVVTGSLAKLGKRCFHRHRACSAKAHANDIESRRHCWGSQCDFPAAVSHCHCTAGSLQRARMWSGDSPARLHAGCYTCD